MGTKITRKTQKIFASNAGGTGVAVPGSVAGGAVSYSTDLATIQSTAFINGLASMIIAGTKRLPVYEEINAVYLTVTQQLAYLFENGIPEWDTGTEYFTTSIVRKTGTYEIYGSINNNNIGNALPAAVSNANWTYLGNLSSLSGTALTLTGDVTGTGTGTVATTIANNAVTTAKILNNNVTLAKLATQAANTVLANATASTDVPSAVSMANSTVLARSASGNIAAHTLLGLNATSGVLAANSGNSLQAPVVSAVTALTTCTGNIPADDTIPQIGEGTQVYSAAITPVSATSIIRIAIDQAVSPASSGNPVTVALFKDSGANAIASTINAGYANSYQWPLPFYYQEVSGSTTARTYTGRVGATGGNAYLNGTGSRVGGGSQYCAMRVREEIA